MAFTFMSSMIKKDMHHLLVDAMRKEDPIRMYQEIQDLTKDASFIMWKLQDELWKLTDWDRN